MSVAIAVVGSGPAGLYAADALIKKCPGCRIDIIDRLPTPFGLVRAGVAPDHQSTKNVIRVFEKTLDKDGVRFCGNVGVGRDISYDELKALYDVVVLAVGAQEPRRLGVPGEDLAGVISATDFVGWYNGVPGAPDCTDDVQTDTAVVVGNGNVAMDVARLLAKTADELAASDIVPAAAAAIARAPLKDIYVIGRRGPMDASFTFPELSELGKLTEAIPLIAGAPLPDDVPEDGDADTIKRQERNLRVLKNYVANDSAAAAVRVHLLFCASPTAVRGVDRVEGLELVRNRIEDGRAVPTGETFSLDCGLVIPAIGYRVTPFPGLPVDDRRGIVSNQDGRVEPGVYVVGWAKRGPTGVIGTNRVDARTVVEEIADDNPKPAGKPGPDGLDKMLAARGVTVVSTADWRQIDAAEIARASGARPRVKFTDIAEMVRIATDRAA